MHTLLVVHSKCLRLFMHCVLPHLKAQLFVMISRPGLTIGGASLLHPGECGAHQQLLAFVVDAQRGEQVAPQLLPRAVRHAGPSAMPGRIAYTS